MSDRDKDMGDQNGDDALIALCVVLAIVAFLAAFSASSIVTMWLMG